MSTIRGYLITGMIGNIFLLFARPLPALVKGYISINPTFTILMVKVFIF
ncbi:hypothetical protein [Sediminibacillus massiliensis]|nr:hypothetical protein [Sediminibacillus massiliensis]